MIIGKLLICCERTRRVKIIIYKSYYAIKQANNILLKPFRVDEELNKLIVEESDSRQKEEKIAPVKQVNNPDLNSQVDADGDIHGGGIGTISFVSCGNREAKEAAEQQTTLSDSTKEEGKRSFIYVVLCRAPSGFRIAKSYCFRL